MATCIDDLFFRVERLTFSAIPTTSGASTTPHVAPAVPRRGQLAPDHRFGSDEQRLDPESTAGRDGSGHHHPRSVVAAHGVDRHAYARD
jgi:hypothetical protein